MSMTWSLLAAMLASVIAKKQKISRIRAFDKFIKSETARMLFDEETGFWLNGPDYIADEYMRESYFKRHRKAMLAVSKIATAGSA